MKLTSIFLTTCFLLFSCGQSSVSNSSSDIINNGLFFGTDSTFEVMTWNLEHFPKNNDTTIEYVSQVVHNLDIDVVGFQEIENASSFISLIEKLNQIDSINVWDGYRSNSISDINLAFIYKSNTVQDVNIYEILEDFGRPFPRPPLVFELTWDSIPLVIICNHLICCGNGQIDGDEWDEERRRQEASLLLEEYINDNFSEQNVILIGDLNDEIDESELTNVFWNFIEDPEDFLFTDMNIATDSSSTYWSYPTWPSHIDHILITNELFYVVEDIQTVCICNYLTDGWTEYYENISDHQPVVLKLYFTQKNN
ncbi:MAG: endonuclease/exonuclease/phosphatase family protein [Candidatus Cloacimonetes bacterium]|nr:endonuclease/exonuclease/phosphatase family protein [Candidatus Cloacimonadota bacterium]MBL7085972.1 endonuclease/exonuclease/phosphatase family protein [Candidatus Cloacimonadota bacterium]